MAYKYSLHGHRLTVVCTVDDDTLRPSLAIDGDELSEVFLPDEIHQERTELGSLVSVQLTKDNDGGGTTFSVFLPGLPAKDGETVEFDTVGYFTRASDPAAIGRQPSTCLSVHLQGVAEPVIAPAAASISAQQAPAVLVMS